MSFSIVVATDEKDGIGKNNKLLWNIPSDLKRFKEITTKKQIDKEGNYGVNLVVMGRKTFESIPNKLKDRYEIIITNKLLRELPKNDKFLISTLKGEGIQQLIKDFKNSEEELFIIGGESIYKQFLPYVNKIYLTEVKGDYNADTFFKFNKDEFKETYVREWQQENGYEFRFKELERII